MLPAYAELHCLTNFSFLKGASWPEELVERAFATYARNPGGPYAKAAGAELAVVAGLPDAQARLAEAESYARHNSWAQACLARARGRRFGDEAALAESVAGWERIGARVERAFTLLLIPGREAEGRAELAHLRGEYVVDT